MGCDLVPGRGRFRWNGGQHRFGRTQFATVEGHTIFGTSGHAQIDIRTGLLDITLYNGRTIVEPPLEEYERYPLHATARQFVDTFLGRSPAVASGELGALTVEFLDAARARRKVAQIVRM